jgi:hypothetical protein
VSVEPTWKDEAIRKSIGWSECAAEVERLRDLNETLENALDELADAAFNRRYQLHGTAILTAATQKAMAVLRARTGEQKNPKHQHTWRSITWANRPDGSYAGTTEYCSGCGAKWRLTGRPS